jgi:hypothetical protein
MDWLLHKRTSEGEWVPDLIPLSDFAGGAVIYAILLAMPGSLILHAIKHLRAGRAEYGGVLWWAVLFWPLFALGSVRHFFAPSTRPWYIAVGIAGVALVPWFLYGVRRVVPLLRRKGG